MYDSSFLLLLKYLVLNIFIPFFPWLLFMWIFYGNKFKWFLLYLLARFVWVWVVAFSLLNIQFIHFWIWVLEYFIILWVLLAIFVWKICIKKQKMGYYIKTLKIKNTFPLMKKSFLSLSIFEKFLVILISIYSIYFVCISWIFNFNLPTYAPDALWNRNKFVYNIYVDWWVKLFGDESEILWRWRLWYPIYIPSYEVLISKFVWSINDIYLNVCQWLFFVFWLLFIFYVTFRKTKNIFLSILPVWVIISLPLVFFHSFEWNLDLTMILYCIVSAWLFYQYLESKDFDYISLWLLFGFIASNIKNDGFIVFFPWLLFALFVVLCLDKKLIFTIKWFFRDKNNLCKSIWYFVYFMLPFLVVRFVNWLWFNQAWFVKSGIWWSDKIHREIFPRIKHCFFEMDNYNLVLVLLLLIFMALFIKKRKSYDYMLFLFAWLFMFLILMAVFLFTVDYQFVMDLTTVNRMFTLCFVMILSFLGFIFDKK